MKTGTFYRAINLLNALELCSKEAKLGLIYKALKEERNQVYKECLTGCDSQTGCSFYALCGYIGEKESTTEKI